MNNKWMDGMFGLVVGDALGVPVEFTSREERIADPVKEMRGHGSFIFAPKGSWSDDSSMALATLDSLKSGYNPDDIMYKFGKWLVEGEYTPFGKVFDVGNMCRQAIMNWTVNQDINKCGGTDENSNGNGSLMRIMPMCLYCYNEEKNGVGIDDIIANIHTVSGLTHNHLRSKIACGLYYFIVKSIIDEHGDLLERIQAGITSGVSYYTKKYAFSVKELEHYNRLVDLKHFKKLQIDEIRSTGYVVDTLEAAVWSLVNTSNYADCVCKCVNLGLDTDTVAAIAGGLAGLYYGFDAIPGEWVNVILKKDYIIQQCDEINREIKLNLQLKSLE